MKRFMIGTDVIGAVTCATFAGIAFARHEHQMVAVAACGVVCWTVSLVLDVRRR